MSTRYSTWHSDSLFCKLGVPYGTNLAEAVAAAGRGVVLPEQQEVDGRAEPRVRVRLRVRVGVRGGVRVRVRVQVLGSGLGFGAYPMTIVPETVVALRASVLLSRLSVPTTCVSGAAVTVASAGPSGQAVQRRPRL